MCQWCKKRPIYCKVYSIISSYKYWPLLVLQTGNNSGIPDGDLENPPEMQYNICDWFVPPLMVLALKQVIVIWLPTETCDRWGVTVAWAIVGTEQDEPTVKKQWIDFMKWTKCVGTMHNIKLKSKEKKQNYKLLSARGMFAKRATNGIRTHICNNQRRAYDFLSSLFNYDMEL